MFLFVVELFFKVFRGAGSFLGGWVYITVFFWGLFFVLVVGFF